MFTQEQKDTLKQLARDSIESYFRQTTLKLPDDPAFQERRGVFVSLHLEGRLRGCIGYIKALKPLSVSIKEMAVAAAFNDSRFRPITSNELPILDIEISILGEMVRINAPSEILVGRDGLYVTHPWGSGLLLPQVAVEWKWDAETFIEEVCRKAGLTHDAWQEPVTSIYRFSAEVF